eukprot:GHVU01113407.1.p1 GENE.GHVU01113407.1~~GHVU01113407.1.p1  ORF type:complete len:385 (+),score=45.21 GHVU01113407.1:2214-3368(+)
MPSSSSVSSTPLAAASSSAATAASSSATVAPPVVGSPEVASSSSSAGAVPITAPQGKGGRSAVPGGIAADSSTAATGSGAGAALRSQPGAPPPKTGKSAAVTRRTLVGPKVLPKAADNRRKDVHKTVVHITVEESRVRPAGVTVPPAKTLDSWWNTCVNPDRTAGDENNTLLISLTGALRGEFRVQVGDMMAAMRLLLGKNFRENYSALTSQQKSELIKQLVELLCKAVLRLQKIAHKFREPAPPVFPHEFKKCSLDAFLDLLETHETKLRLAYGDRYDANRETIIDEYTRMTLDEAVKEPRARDDYMHATLARQWEALRLKYPLIHRLAQGLATIYPGNGDVERDFAILKWLYGPLRSCMSVASIMGTLLCRQLEQLRNLPTS